MKYTKQEYSEMLEQVIKEAKEKDGAPNITFSSLKQDVEYRLDLKNAKSAESVHFYSDKDELEFYRSRYANNPDIQFKDEKSELLFFRQLENNNGAYKREVDPKLVAVCGFILFLFFLSLTLFAFSLV